MYKKVESNYRNSIFSRNGSNYDDSVTDKSIIFKFQIYHSLIYSSFFFFFSHSTQSYIRKDYAIIIIRDKQHVRSTYFSNYLVGRFILNSNSWLDTSSPLNPRHLKKSFGIHLRPHNSTNKYHSLNIEKIEVIRIVSFWLLGFFNK